jgi:uncharacterized protein YbjQ (UPF0145 family)
MKRVDVSGNRGAGGQEPDPRLVRLDRLGRSRGWSFPGPVGEFAASSGAGFDPLARVFGTTVSFLGSVGYGRCFAAGAAKRTGATTADPYNPLLAGLYEGRRKALERTLAECRALGGDGVIGARMTAGGFFSDTTEFTVDGTAVRARSQTRPPAPFTTHVSGQELARLLRAGWMPCALVFGVAIAACHFDDGMFQQTARRVGAGGNREVSGYTRLVNDARREARNALAYEVGKQGGHGAVVQEMSLRFFERECPLIEERSDYVVEAVILGSALVEFERREPAARAPLTIMRLDRRAEPPAAEPERAGSAGPGLGDRAFAYWTARSQALETGSGDEA